MRVQQTANGFVLRPVVAFLIPYLGLCALWFLYLVLFVQFPDEEGVYFISGTQLAWASGVNICWVLILALDMSRCRSWHISVRRGQVTSVVLGLVTVLLLQMGFLLGYDPFILGSMFLN